MTTHPLCQGHIREPTSTPRITVRVEPDSMTVFTKMCPENEDVGAIKWVRFFDAMADAGFAITIGSESAVKFNSPDGEAIVLHRPHPDPS